ncbi:hypothetical protein O181_131727 [Austropuccinia psidii MF-1]|uniref:Uncharacterized protein n=1 Tax=Austropuccinia psidii MF-1 TaxID=1389203 RepID=A0A9Q3QDH2_9BASI|nr:hypothetical protein [Austropuccinia psidii MF-1]
MLPPNHLILCATYHPYAPAAPSRCDSKTATPSLPSQLLTLPHPHHLELLRPCCTLKISLQYRHLISMLTPLMPDPLCRLPSLRFCIRYIEYGGLLAYTMNAITEICLVASSANRFLGEIGGDIHNFVVRVSIMRITN